jgi:putative hemolysin
VEDSCLLFVLTSAAVPPADHGSIFVNLLVIAGLILINAFFAATEIAIISLNDTKIRRQAEEGDQTSVKIDRLIDEPSRFLATIQVGVTLAGFLSSAFAADNFADRLYLLIGVDLPVVRTVCMILVTLILAFFSLVFGELVPKRIAQNNPEKMAAAAVGAISVAGTLMYPFVRLLTVSTNLVLRLLRIDPTRVDRSVTEEEIRMRVDVGREMGSIHEEEKEMIENIFEFNDIPVKEIMTHRTDIISVSVDATYEEVMDIALNEHYTRIPVYEENIDNIIGILHIKDLLRFAMEPHDQFCLRDLIRPPYLVPESKSSDAVFRDMQKAKAQIAIVIDEYGGTAGLITIEDLLEEIVGNIQDEYDEEEPAIARVDERTYLIQGMTPLDEVGETLGVKFPDEDFETLAGLVISLLAGSRKRMSGRQRSLAICSSGSWTWTTKGSVGSRLWFCRRANRSLQMMKTERRWDAVLFDVDGTLIDSVPFIVESFQYAYRRHLGQPQDEAQILAGIGMPLEEAFSSWPPELARALMTTYLEYNHAYLHEGIGIFYQVPPVLDHLCHVGLPLGIVTSKRLTALRPTLQDFDLERFFNVIITKEDTTRHKPHPDPSWKRCAVSDCSSRRVFSMSATAFTIWRAPFGPAVSR